MENQNLAQGVKELRKMKSFSQDELAKKAGLSLRTVQRVENGETIPTAETLKRLASVLEVLPNELMEFSSEKEVANIVLKTKHEYIHFFDSKLVFSKTPEINLVEDYGKSVSYVFKTLMVMLVSIPLFTAIGIYFYSVENMAVALFSGIFAFFYLIASLNIMLFGSGTPVINITDITNIKMERKSFFSILNISILESGRIKQRGLILEKDQVQPVIDALLAVNMLDKKDIKVNPKSDKIKIGLFCVYLIAIGLFQFYFPKQSYLNTYFQSGILLITCLVLIVKMFINSIFLNRESLKRGFLDNDKKMIPLATKV